MRLLPVRDRDRGGIDGGAVTPDGPSAPDKATHQASHPRRKHAPPIHPQLQLARRHPEQVLASG
ncbi:hypothetical protein HMPREF1316_2491 [Olsenella profusa F0195]|uniref:Uncharacterized protein n=1 Tax=Olsenella profusa F0195 TaxID=1125712 RepID=U2V2R4_9ACTN|nr:hypothetical protein HMPREF1316_2491 [Olsenella profusa F0195]